ncbi:MAG: NfeD family protein [Firmicutes bacterium]|nr:NfeD family protein [Bacillota bacterium]
MIEILIWFWLGLFLLAVIFEAATVDFVAIWFAVGSVPAFILAIVGAPIWLQVTTFLVITIVLISFTRPYMLRYFKTNQIKTNAQSVIGKTATVSEVILPNEIGAVKLRGQEWSAIASSKIEVGTEVRILEIEGVKLIVEAIK